MCECIDLLICHCDDNIVYFLYFNMQDYRT